MNSVHSLMILLGAFVAVWLESAWMFPRRLLGAQVDLLPALMVYASLSSNLGTVTATAVLGGLWFDSLSANPFGVSVLPLFLAGFFLHRSRTLIIRELPYAQVMLGLAVSAAVPLATLLLLVSMGERPLLGWGSLWQWIVMSAGGALFTPVWFRLFGLVHRNLDYQPAGDMSFRPDREIKRGKQ